MAIAPGTDEKRSGPNGAGQQVDRHFFRPRKPPE